MGRGGALGGAGGGGVGGRGANGGRVELSKVVCTVKLTE